MSEQQKHLDTSFVVLPLISPYYPIEMRYYIHVCLITCRFSHCYTFLINLPKEDHIWCGYADIMSPFLETFHGFFDDEDENSSLRIIWRRVSLEMGICTQCVCEHHQAQGFFNTEYQSDTVDPLLKVLRLLDEERVTGHLIQINTKIQLREYDPSCHGAEVVSIMFEVCFIRVMPFQFLFLQDFLL